MFENACLFAILKDNSILKVETDAQTQEDINEVFAKGFADILNKEKVDFNGSYSPSVDESLVIKNFVIYDAIKDSIRNPLSVESMEIDEKLEIKALYIGSCETNNDRECFKIAFQKFRKEQYIRIKGIRLLFNHKTFQKDERQGIVVSENIDCIFVDNDLIFTSYFYARQVFDLSSYYRTATNADVRDFITQSIISYSGDIDDFIDNANTIVRRKIATIKDSNVLNQFSAEQIKVIAKQKVGIDIEVQNKKIVFPSDKEQQKILLRCLDEEAWKGPFSNETYMTNSKRKVFK